MCLQAQERVIVEECEGNCWAQSSLHYRVADVEALGVVDKGGLVVWYSFTHLQCCTDSMLSLWRLASLNSLWADLLWRHCGTTFFHIADPGGASELQRLRLSPSVNPVCTCPLSREVSSAGRLSQRPLPYSWPPWWTPASPPYTPCGTTSWRPRAAGEKTKWKNGTCGGKKYFCTNSNCTCEKHTQIWGEGNYFLVKSDVLFCLGDSPRQRCSVHQHIKQGNHHNNISDSAAWEIIFYFSTDFLFFLQ